MIRSLFVCVSLAAVVLSAPRQKRFTVGTISVSSQGSAGASGCVVTGNTLYANGFKLRELTSEEQNELEKYQSSLEEYKTELRAAVAKHQKEFTASWKDKKINPTTAAKKTVEDLPKAPTKPSFCTAEDTTQYIFDGCMVQNNRVYVGDKYARDLSEAEIEELKEFDAKQTVYQKYITEQVQKQVNNIFGSNNNPFASFFNQGQQQAEETAEETTTRSSVTTTAEPAPEAPHVPQFCTAIY